LHAATFNLLSLPLAYDPPAAAAAQTTQANELLTVPGHHIITQRSQIGR